VDVTSLKLVFRRDLSDEEKKGYIDAVKCLQSLPAQNPVIPAAKTRFDEFHAHHIKIAEQVHYVVSIGRGNTLQAFSHLLVRGNSFLGTGIL